MFSNAVRIIPRQIRSYSTPDKMHLWIKHDGYLPMKVPIKGCKDMDDFSKKVKQMLNTYSPVAIFTSLAKDPIRPGLKISELLHTELKNNSDEKPLFAKIIPATPDSIAKKVIYVGETDEDGDFTGEFKRTIIRNDHDLMKIIKDARGLVPVSSLNTFFVSFDDIKDGEKYFLYMFAQNFQSWQKKEADAMEAETLLSMKTYLMEKLAASSIDLPTDIYDSNKTKIQEWDGVLLSEDTLYLLEAKHSMSVEKIREIANRVDDFPNTIKKSKQKEFNVKYSKIVGVACGTRFPDKSREEAHRLGLLIVYPSGSRYLVESDKMDIAYAIER